MSKEKDSRTDDLQREMRAQQKFSVAGAIGRAGSGLLKGESPVSQQEQSLAQLTQWIDQHIPDPSGALKSVLSRRLASDELLMARHLKESTNALREMLDTLLASDFAIQEFVRQVDVRWGEMYQERPLFQSARHKPDSADPYTNESVRQTLLLLLDKLP